ncbi:MAG: hypothetical protein IKD66_00660 [Solobacterium sp.]|nr:hypothetical protein [Solobacterium sp.]
MRLIDADALKEVFIQTLENIKSNPRMTGQEMHIITAIHTVGQMIDDMPTIDAVPVRHGKWKVTSCYIKCSECGECFMLIPQNFCPFCGASPKWLSINDLRGPVGYTYSYIACQLCGGAMIDGNPKHCLNDLVNHWNLRDKRNSKYEGGENESKSRKDKGFGWRG